MAESAAHLVDEVFPHKPLRQWVLSFPFPLRLLFAKDPQIMGLVLNLIHRAISTYLIKKTGFKKKSGAKTGSVTFIQRFGGSLNLNIHFHIMYLDGIYTFEQEKASFHPITPPSQSEPLRTSFKNKNPFWFNTPVLVSMPESSLQPMTEKNGNTCAVISQDPASAKRNFLSISRVKSSTN